jgi:hypothetical protein
MVKRKLGSTADVAPLAFGGNVFGWTVDRHVVPAAGRSSTQAST